jgi:hypothetical protein
LEGGPPIFGQGFTCPALLEDQRAPLPVPGCHRLRRAVPGASGSSSLITGLIRFRSPLLAESHLMSFPPATEMVQFAGFASSSYGFTEGYPKRGGLPHSDIRGSTLARNSPRLFAACHVLHRLSVPRHPPDALTSRSPTPSPKRARSARLAEDRGQTTEDRQDAGTSGSLLFSVLCDLVSGARRKPPRQSALAFAYPCPDPAKTDVAGPASRFHDSLHDVREQRTEDREQTGRPAVRALCKLEEAGVGGRRSTLPLSDRFVGPIRRPREPGPAGHRRPSVLCSLSSDLRLSGGPGPT